MSEVEKDARINSFIMQLEKLDAADRARLKRNSGKALAEARNVNMLIFHILPHGLSRRQEEIYYLVATLFPLAASGGHGSLGASLRQAQTKSNSKGLDRRIEALLDAEGAQLSFRLRQTIHFLQSNRVPVAWGRLLSDLLQWHHPDRYIQQSWARDYYSTASTNNN